MHIDFDMMLHVSKLQLCPDQCNQSLCCMMRHLCNDLLGSLMSLPAAYDPAELLHKDTSADTHICIARPHKLICTGSRQTASDGQTGLQADQQANTKAPAPCCPASQHQQTDANTITQQQLGFSRQIATWAER